MKWRATRDLRPDVRPEHAGRQPLPALRSQRLPCQRVTVSSQTGLFTDRDSSLVRALDEHGAVSLRNRKYLGSKVRLLDFIEREIRLAAGDIESFLDGFAGTGSGGRPHACPYRPPHAGRQSGQQLLDQPRVLHLLRSQRSDRLCFRRSARPEPLCNLSKATLRRTTRGATSPPRTPGSSMRSATRSSSGSRPATVPSRRVTYSSPACCSPLTRSPIPSDNTTPT